MTQAPTKNTAKPSQKATREPKLTFIATPATCSATPAAAAAAANRPDTRGSRRRVGSDRGLAVASTAADGRDFRNGSVKRSRCYRAKRGLRRTWGGSFASTGRLGSVQYRRDRAGLGPPGLGVDPRNSTAVPFGRDIGGAARPVVAVDH